MGDVDYFRDTLYLVGLLIVIAIPIAAYFLFRWLFTPACDCVPDEKGTPCQNCTPNKGRPPVCKKDGSNIENCTVCLWSKIRCGLEDALGFLARIPACGFNGKCLCAGRTDEEQCEKNWDTTGNVFEGLLIGFGSLILIIVLGVIGYRRRRRSAGEHSVGFKDRLVSVLSSSREANVWMDDG